MRRTASLLFACASAAALVLYWATVPQGLPWTYSSHLALAYLGEIVPLPTMPHPVWGSCVRLFGGAVALSVMLAALATGVIAFVVCRLFGRRMAVSAAVVWMFLPGVWNRAIIGERSVCLLAVAVLAAGACSKIGVRAFERMWRFFSQACGARVLPTATHESNRRRNRLHRRAGHLALCLAGITATISVSVHDYRLGDAASAFARGIVHDAGDRTIVMNGSCDDQIVRELQLAAKPNGKTAFAVSLRVDDASRTNLAAWVETVYPSDTNLWVAAQVGGATFVEAALKSHPERFYAMDGASTTFDAWTRRWTAFSPYLNSSDPFVGVARRLFAYEGNAVAGRMSEPKSAWKLYRRIFEQVDPGNFSALVNLSELMRDGFAVKAEERKRVNEALVAFCRKPGNLIHVREIMRAAGPVKIAPERLAKLEDEMKTRLKARLAAGERIDISPEVLSLIEWNNEMVRLMDRGELESAGRIARLILSNPQWSDFVPANGVMGSVMAKEGNLAASERFFAAALRTTNAVPAVVLNDFADVLMRLGKLAEAEAMARRSVAASDEKLWVARLTLMQILSKKGGADAEVKTLQRILNRTAPSAIRAQVSVAPAH